MSKNIEKGLPEIGYVYHFPELDHPTDKFRLEINISTIPTEEHFDVLRVYVWAVNSQGYLERIKIAHPWEFDETIKVCAGVVILEDRKGKKEEAFTFGGRLEIETKSKQTACSLVSSAPILEISGVSRLHRLFTEELEILLAKRKAALPDQQAYEKLLCGTDPLELYQACLNDLIKKFKQVPEQEEVYLKLVHYLQTEKHRLKTAGISQEESITLDELFSR